MHIVGLMNAVKRRLQEVKARLKDKVRDDYTKWRAQLKEEFGG